MNMTKHRWVFVLAVCGLVCVLTQQSSAQQAPLPTPGVIRINVNLVQVDAVVTDSKGKPVTNLRADDFEVLQDGKVQKIRNFEFVRVRDTLGSLVVRPATLLPPGGPGAPPLPAAALKPNQVLRTIALVVDDIGLSYDGTLHTREALKKWVDNEMQPGDLVSIVRTNAAMGALQQLTSDKRVLYAAIDHLKFQPGRIGVESFRPFTGALPEGFVLPDTSVFDGEVANAYLSGSLNAIRYVMQGLRELPGRKTLILFSEDMQLNSLDTQRQSIEDRLRGLAEEANRSSVVIHAIDPRGVIYTGPTAADNLTGFEPAQMAAMINARSQQHVSSQDGMVLLSQRTGGLFYHSNDLAGSLRQAVDDGDGYYLMGYQPEQTTFEEKEGLLRYHSIKVRLKRPGLTVRSRTGFFGKDDVRSSTLVPQTREKQIARALVSPFTTADIKVRLTAFFSHSDAGGSSIQVLLHFDAHDLTFTEEPDGTRTAAVDIAIVKFDDNGDASQIDNKTWTLRLPQQRYDEVLKQGLVYSTSIPTKKAGAYQLRVAVRDAASEKLGSAMQFIEAPDVDSGRLTLSGIVVEADTRLEDDPEGTPAVRVFKSGGTIAYAYQILNARTGGSEQGHLESRTRLYRDGQLVYEGMPSTLNPDGQKDAKHLAVGGRMQLTKISPGDYVLQVIVLDNLRKDKNRIAAQSIDFEVRQ